MFSKTATARLHECRKERIKQRLDDLYKLGAADAQRTLNGIYHKRRLLKATLPTIIEDTKGTSHQMSVGPKRAWESFPVHTGQPGPKRHKVTHTTHRHDALSLLATACEQFGK